MPGTSTRDWLHCRTRGRIEGPRGAAKLLENPSDDVAAKADVSGRIDAPDVSTWDVVVSVVRNAFISAIAPGIEGIEGAPAAESEG